MMGWLNRGLLFTMLCLMAVQAFAVEFGVFSDVNITRESRSKQEAGFVLGGLDLFATHDVGEKTKAFMEFVFEDVGGGQFIVDLERLWIKYTIDNMLTISAGRFHTPIGFWNKNYHHGTLIQDTVTRPFFLDFEDGEAGVLPVHAVGLRLRGRGAIGRAIVSYDFLVANGSAVDTKNKEILVNNVTDPGDEKAVLLALTYEYAPVGLEMGLFALKTHYSDFAALDPGAEFNKQRIWGFDVRYNVSRFYVLAELFVMENRNMAVISDLDAQAWYAQFGYRVTENFSLIYRKAELEFERQDLFFSALGVTPDQGKHKRHDVFGIRYNIDESNALKLEYNADNRNELISMQWSFLLF